VDLEPLLFARLPQYSEASRQPPVIRDLAIVVDQTLEVRHLIDGMRLHGPSVVQEISLFDLYVGRGVEAGKKSLAFRIVMQDTQKTLLEAEVEATIQHLVDYVQDAFAARLRV
jgi:phenylalanyl-tRNA synthetase beta chain